MNKYINKLICAAVFVSVMCTTDSIRPLTESDRLFFYGLQMDTNSQKDPVLDNNTCAAVLVSVRSAADTSMHLPTATLLPNETPLPNLEKIYFYGLMNKNSLGEPVLNDNSLDGNFEEIFKKRIHRQTRNVECCQEGYNQIVEESERTLSRRDIQNFFEDVSLFELWQ
jgi:hypothetical protein